MATKHLEAQTSVTVPLLDGTHRFLDAGQTVPESEVAPHFLEAAKDKDSYTGRLVKGVGSGSKDDPATDPAALSMQAVEELSRARADLPEQDRHGTAAPDREPPLRTQTLPASGADFVSDLEYAKHGNAHHAGEATDRGLLETHGSPAPSNDDAAATPADTDAGQAAHAAAEKEDANRVKQAAADQKAADKK